MKEFNQAVDTLRPKATEVSQASTVPDYIFPGAQVLVWRKAKPRRWDGPSHLISAVRHVCVKSSQKLLRQLPASSTAKKFILGVLVDSLLPPENSRATNPPASEHAGPHQSSDFAPDVLSKHLHSVVGFNPSSDGQRDDVTREEFVRHYEDDEEDFGV